MTISDNKRPRKKEGKLKCLGCITPINKELSADVSAESFTTPRRTRTYDPLIKSPELQHFDDVESTSGQQGYTGESECQQMINSLENKGDSAIAAVGESASGVQANDCGGCSSGHSSDKQNDKQNDKRVSTDPDLRQVIDAWADLPEVVKTGMLAMVEASRART
jgi:hypothetical protein